MMGPGRAAKASLNYRVINKNPVPWMEKVRKELEKCELEEEDIGNREEYKTKVRR